MSIPVVRETTSKQATYLTELDFCRYTCDKILQETHGFEEFEDFGGENSSIYTLDYVCINQTWTFMTDPFVKFRYVDVFWQLVQQREESKRHQVQ